MARVSRIWRSLVAVFPTWYWQLSLAMGVFTLLAAAAAGFWFLLAPLLPAIALIMAALRESERQGGASN